MLYIVTVKLPKNKGHDPRNKKTGACPLDADALCTDVTGEHHTILVDSPYSYKRVEEQLKEKYHVTRIEDVSGGPHGDV